MAKKRKSSRKSSTRRASKRSGVHCKMISTGRGRKKTKRCWNSKGRFVKVR